MPRGMLSAFALALGQLTDRRVLRILAKSLAITIAIFVVVGAAGWWGIDRLLQTAGVDGTRFAAADGVRGLASLVFVIVGGWLLWRVVALAVMQFFADEVVEAVEVRHYPEALASASNLDWRTELRLGWRGAMRAILFNLLAAPFALVLLATGVGAAAVFWLVNAVLIGRELADMVWLRYGHLPDAPQPIGRVERLMLGGIVTALLAAPFANLLAPIIGAAMATHLVHRKGTLPHAA
jgi:CysZ protein